MLLNSTTLCTSSISKTLSSLHPRRDLSVSALKKPLTAAHAEITRSAAEKTDSIEKPEIPPVTPHDPSEPQKPNPAPIPLPPDADPQPTVPVREPDTPLPITDPNPPEPTRLIGMR